MGFGAILKKWRDVSIRVTLRTCAGSSSCSRCFTASEKFFTRVTVCSWGSLTTITVLVAGDPNFLLFDLRAAESATTSPDALAELLAASCAPWLFLRTECSRVSLEPQS